MKKIYFMTVAASVAAVAAGIAVILVSARTKSDTDMRYQEVVVEYKTLSDGKLKARGVIEQKFDPDISALVNVEGVQDSQMDSALLGLQVSEVLVSAGQQVKRGTPLFRATPDSVDTVRSILQKEAVDAARNCSALRDLQKQTRLLVAQQYDSAVMDGRYADMLCAEQCAELERRADDAKTAVEDKQNQINENLQELAQAQQELAQAQKFLREAQAAVSESYDNRYDNAYYYTVYENTRESAQNMTGQLEEKVKSLTEKNEQLLYEADEAVRTYHQVLLDTEKEKLAARMDCDMAACHSETAQQWREVQTAYLENDLQDAQNDYLSKLQNLRAFDAETARGRVVSDSSGTVAEVVIAPGDCVQQNDTIVIMYGRERTDAGEEKAVLCVPEKAVFREGDRAYVRLRTEDGNVVERAVRTGFTDGAHTEIVEGASAGDVVLVAAQ
ncbi:MAG: hypothetical protein K2P39_14990 [Lachnospiraceae bacterium]|nr:hypothetical protein [Lachnospiraceae bacterium]